MYQFSLPAHFYVDDGRFPLLRLPRLPLQPAPWHRETAQNQHQGEEEDLAHCDCASPFKKQILGGRVPWRAG